MMIISYIKNTWKETDQEYKNLRCVDTTYRADADSDRTVSTGTKA